MSHWQVMFFAVLAIFAVACVGALARRLDWLTEEADRSLLTLVVKVLFPAFVLDVTWDSAVLRDPKNLVWPPLVGAVSVLLGFAVAWYLGKAMGGRAGVGEPAQRRTFALCVGLYNYGYVPLPLAAALFGRETMSVMFVHNLGVEVVMWTVGVMLISGHVARDWPKRILNGPTLAIIASLVLNFTGGHAYVPDFVRQGIHLIAGAAIPLSVILIGAIAADEFNAQTVRRGGRVVFWSCVLRLGVLPAMFLGLALLVPASTELKRVIAIQAAMPTATFPIVMARTYNGDPATALRVCIGTSAVSLATMTLWLSAGLWLLGVR